MAGLPTDALAVLLVALGGFALWIWALVDCALRCPRERRGIWIVIIAVFNAVGAVLYLVFRKRLLSRARGEHAA